MISKIGLLLILLIIGYSWAQNNCTIQVMMEDFNQAPDVATITDQNFGTVFKVSKDGFVIAINFFKLADETGPHTGKLWDYDTKQLLATVSFATETSSGWRSAFLASPFYILQGKQYVVSVNANSKKILFKIKRINQHLNLNS